MRYHPFKGRHALKKDSHISKYWTEELLEVVARARRILGTKGAFPPTNTLSERFASTTEIRDLFKIDTVKGITLNDPNQSELMDFT